MKVTQISLTRNILNIIIQFFQQSFLISSSRKINFQYLNFLPCFRRFTTESSILQTNLNFKQMLLEHKIVNYLCRYFVKMSVATGRQLSNARFVRFWTMTTTLIFKLQAPNSTRKQKDKSDVRSRFQGSINRIAQQSVDLLNNNLMFITWLRKLLRCDWLITG